MNNILLTDLLKKQREHTATSAELDLLESWYLHESAKAGDKMEGGQLELAGQEIWSKVLQDTHLDKSIWAGKIWYKLAAAVMILISISVGFYFYANTKSLKEEQILPGEDQATLTLGDGKVIDLNTITEGRLADQEGSVISKSADGSVVYGNSKTQVVPKYHTIRTPKGGQYKVVLSDGSTVWLNAPLHR